MFAAADVPMRDDSELGALSLDQNWLSEDQATRLYSELLAECAWTSEEIFMYGRRITVPRRTAWYGDPGLNYRYSGRDHMAAGWLDSLVTVRDELSQQFSQPFNYVLVNRYRDGRDYMGWHSDDEAGVCGGIASVSLGRERRFTIREKPQIGLAQADAKPGPISSIVLAHGSLLFMPRGFQQRYLHALPKAPPLALASRASGQACERLNLTFRWLENRL